MQWVAMERKGDISDAIIKDVKRAGYGGRQG